MKNGDGSSVGSPSYPSFSAAGANGEYTESVSAGRGTGSLRRLVDPGLDVEALLQGLERLLAFQLDPVRFPVRPAVGMPQIQVLRGDLVEHVPHARPVRVGVLVAGEPVGGTVHLHRVADERVVLTVDHVGDRPGRVPGIGVHRDRDIPTERQRFAAAHQHGRLHLAGDDGVRRRDLLRLPLGVVQVAAAAGEVLVDVGPARPQHGRVGLVDHDLRLPAGHLPQRVRAADVVDVAVGQQDPAHVLDPAAEGLERGRHALGGRGRDPGVHDRRFGRVDEEAVQPEPTPRRDEGMDLRHCSSRPPR